MLKQIKTCNSLFPEVGRYDRIQMFLQQKKEQKRQEKQQKERNNRQKGTFEVLKSEYETAVNDYNRLMSSCSAGQDMLLEVGMYLEQVGEIVATNEYEVAADAMPFVREAQGMLNAIKANCDY